MNTPPTPIEAAIELHDQGIRVIPVRADGTKAPALRAWQNHETTTDDLITWFDDQHGAPRHTALGVATGAASGNLEMVEIEGEFSDLAAQVSELATGAGEDTAALLRRVTQGWFELSPSGGYHYFYRVDGDPVPGNTKLAQDTPRDVDGRRLIPTIAETRGEGGQVVVAPTDGTAHQSGKPWIRVAGGPGTVATITDDEREALLGLFRLLNRRDHPSHTGDLSAGPMAQADATARASFNDNGGKTPPDDFESKNEWSGILVPHGWVHVFNRGNTAYWRRPGKSIGFSATTGHAEDRDRLYVFTTSTEFPAEEPVTKFGAYALLNHGGDHAAAARALRKDGYGEPARPHLHSTDPGPAQPKATGTDGTVVALADHQPRTDKKPNLQPVAGYGLELTDDSNASALINTYGNSIRYHAEKSVWLAWESHYWKVQPKTGGLARELAKETARRLPENGVDGADKNLKHKRYSLSDRGMNAMLNTARTSPEITVVGEDLDAHPWELNTPAGIVDLRTGEIAPPDPTKLHTRTTPIAPSRDADRSLWDQFLTQTFPEQEVRDYIQRLAGYSAVGEVREHILPFAHGDGGNGKGVFLESLHAVLGTYAGKAPANFLMSSQNVEHTTSIADLAGKRFVLTSEVNQKDRFDEQKVKELTGGDTITARHMYQDFFEFTPTHQLWIMGNDTPAVESGGKAFWRRLRLIPFTHSVPEDERIEGLQTILARDYGPAILQWIIDGAVLYGRHGLGEEPASVRAATEDYASEVDTVGRFLAEECYTGDAYADQSTRVSDFRAAYERWCESNGVSALGGRRLPTHLARHGVRVGRNAPKSSDGTRLYGGVLLRGTATGHDHTAQLFKDD